MGRRRVDIERPEMAELRVLEDRLDELRLAASPLRSGAESGRVSGSSKPADDQRSAAMGRAYEAARQRIRRLNSDIGQAITTGKMPSSWGGNETKPCPSCGVGNWWNNRFCFNCGDRLEFVRGSHGA